MKTGVVLLGVTLVAAAAGYLAYRQWAAPAVAPAVVPSSASAPSSAAATAATPAIAPVAADATPKPVIPTTVPDVSFIDLAGKKRSLRDFHGHPTVYNFWATWCGPCRREIPLLNTLHREFAGQHLEIVGVAVDFKDEVAKYAQATHFDYPLLIGEQEGMDAATKFGIEELVLPFSIFVDSKQQIVAAKVGELHRDDADAILNALFAVDRGQLPIEQARSRITTRLHELAQARAAK